ncbi:DUF885 domain-containing protein [Kineococcus gynurae]|uniref:DUF885 domain-containing protein n=1 Tax=Kineococcus gynurae TaxID=452979 RepID=A0ABV5LRL0_9ACTN
MPTPPRTASALDQLAEAHLAALLRRQPTLALALGVPDAAPGLGDRSPDGIDAVAEQHRRTLAGLERVPVRDEVDRVTAAALRDRLGVELALHERHEDLASLNVIDSPVQDLRMVFDLLPEDGEDERADVTARLASVPAAVTGYVESLRLAADRGRVSARRQVLACAAECEQYAAPDGFFATYAARHDDEARRRAGRDAAQAYADLAAFLRQDLLPLAPAADPVGEERYALFSRAFLGAEVDLAETYAWGLEEVRRIRVEMGRVATEICGSPDVAAAIAALEADPTVVLPGAEAFRDWMQQRSDEAVAALAGTHFDIPEPLRRLECRIAPTTTGGIYYTPPSEDLARPGRMWWAVPEGQETFATWREATTVHHEGVPGHHLQLGVSTIRTDLLNRWRRSPSSWVSGHGEGWALYAERLSLDLGLLRGPGEVLGMLDAQLLRAARVVIDIGVHCGLGAPAEVEGGDWTYEKAWSFLRSCSGEHEGVLRYELDRYLGWPGQAPSYKVGQRLWEEVRDEAADRARRAGEPFDLRAFHSRALTVGSLGLDVLRTALIPA